ncbi:hypothetical protein ALI22I_36375 [Saccharothrix sp. ALI-22-I]|uniref:hypothetical protein n=1 Tax=Saccharothrix sp. ALI-22-I TaxID=1933778 RepID=UPI0009D532B5|nr:hypothetical protein [Saccharothrix sp. ALI-22-I]ONI83904.1 hypothetical protein ALI22I_36375 [Saccharothrix sp. ALI-22-I]
MAEEGGAWRIEMGAGAVELRRAAFGDRPEVEVWGALRGGVEERWLAAVVLGGQGHYAAAASVLGELIVGGGLFGSLAASTLASHRRQLGGHAAARVLDGRALAMAPAGGGGDEDDVDAAGARADALLGLAADAIGAGRLTEARRLHARVEPHGWRSRVRHQWLAAEIALAGGHAEHAVPPAEVAAATAREANGTRHILKSDLVLGVALVVWGTPESVGRGLNLLQCDLNHTDRRRLFSLIWPTALVLANAQADRTIADSSNVKESAKNALSCVLRRADPLGRRLAAHSPWVPTALLRSGEPPNADAQMNFLTD